MAITKGNKTVDGFSESFTVASNYGADLYYPSAIALISDGLVSVFTQNVADIGAFHLKPGDLSHKFKDQSNEPLHFSINPTAHPESSLDDYPTIEDKQQRILAIEDYVKRLKSMDGPAQTVRELEGERERSNAYKKIIEARPALKKVNFDEDGDGIITDKEFSSVQKDQRTSANSEWETLKEEIKILNQENTPSGVLLKRVEEGLTGQGLMNNDPDSLAAVGLIPTGAISALRGAIFGEGGKDKKKKNEDFWCRILLMQQIDARIAAIDERMDVVGGYIDALEGVLDKLKKGEAVELNPDGSLKDAIAESAIREFEDMFDMKVNRKSQTELAKVHNYYDGDYKRLETRREGYEQAKEKALIWENDKQQLDADILQKSRTEAGKREINKISAEADTKTQLEVMEVRPLNDATAAIVTEEILSNDDGDSDYSFDFASNSSASATQGVENIPIEERTIMPEFAEANNPDQHENDLAEKTPAPNAVAVLNITPNNVG